MKKKVRIMAIAALIALAFSVPVSAQTFGDEDAAPAGLRSNTSRSTAGVFGNEVDDSMSVLWYKGVEINNWAGFIGYGGNTTTNPLSVGFAKWFGANSEGGEESSSGLYLGVWYTGNILSANNKEEITVTNTYDLDNQLQSSTQTETSYDGFYTNSNNQIEVLIGIADMGIKVGFWENMNVWKKPDISDITVLKTLNGSNVTTTNAYDEDTYKRVKGHMMPYLGWGMELEVAGLKIRPTAKMGFDIYQDKYIYDTKGTASATPGSHDPEQLEINGQFIGIESLQSEDGYNRGYFAPSIGINGEVALPQKKENISMSANIGYGLKLKLYNNAYSVFGEEDKVKGTVDWSGSYKTTARTPTGSITTEYTELAVNEITQRYHSISAGLWLENKITETFKVGLYAGIPVDIERSIQSNTEGGSKTTNKVTTVSNNTTTSTTRIETTETDTPLVARDFTEIKISPSVNLGAVYNMIPGRFTINTGISVAPCAFTNTSIKTSKSSNIDIVRTKTEENGNVLTETVAAAGATDTTEDFASVERNWEGLSAGIWGGFAFNFTPNAALDMCIGAGLVDSSKDDFSFDITELSVLFKIKF
jgi:hypothetical protein